MESAVASMSKDELAAWRARSSSFVQSRMRGPHTTRTDVVARTHEDSWSERRPRCYLSELVLPHHDGGVVSATVKLFLG